MARVGRLWLVATRPRLASIRRRPCGSIAKSNAHRVSPAERSESLAILPLKTWKGRRRLPIEVDGSGGNRQMSPEQETLAVQCVANVRRLVARGIVARRDGELEPAATSLQPDTHPSTTRQRLAGAYDLPRSALRDDPTGLVQRKAKPFGHSGARQEMMPWLPMLGRVGHIQRSISKSSLSMSRAGVSSSANEPRKISCGPAAWRPSIDDEISRS